MRVLGPSNCLQGLHGPLQEIATKVSALPFEKGQRLIDCCLTKKRIHSHKHLGDASDYLPFL